MPRFDFDMQEMDRDARGSMALIGYAAASVVILIAGGLFFLIWGIA